MNRIKVIISGGGTGGHIFPAIAIADTIKARFPDSQILFVGAEDRMEMKRVPAAGYEIVGLPVSGFHRKRILSNFSVIMRLMTSLKLSKKIIKSFKPNIAIGVGGYASGPLLFAASQVGIPTLIQEQNSYAGITNKILAKKARRICVAYPHMEQFFPSYKIRITGTPCRQDLLNNDISREEAVEYFKLEKDKKTILIIGGSLGSVTLNKCIISALDTIATATDVQIVWQCGERYLHELSVQTKGRKANNIHLFDFIDRMDLAYKVADLVVSRAGAGSITELSLLAKPTILIPSPNVSEDHQTKNAKALVVQNAALMVNDEDAKFKLVDLALQTIEDEQLLQTLSNNIKQFAHPDAANKIVDEIVMLLTNNRGRAEQTQRNR